MTLPMPTIAAPRDTKAILSVEALSKGFPGVQALRDFSLTVQTAEVMALVGENGAGKSTLLKILTGEYVPDQGRVQIAGQDMHFGSPLDARTKGFRLVRQEPEIVPYLSVAENIFLGEWPQQALLVQVPKMLHDAQAVLEKWHLQEYVDIRSLGDSLSPAQRHIVEIAKALKSGAKVLAFDEPTASFTSDETKVLFELIERLREQGLAVIYVSHRMDEIMRIADRIAVLRDGVGVALLNKAQTTMDEIVHSMVGRDLSHIPHSDASSAQKDIVLEVKNLSSAWHEDIQFYIRAGEIVGFAGLIGAGRSELAKVLFGALPKRSGTILMHGKACRIRSARDAIQASIGFAPEDRKGEGLLMVRSVLENTAIASLQHHSCLGWVRAKQLWSLANPLLRMLEVKAPSFEQEVGKLSGGNQQKVVLARWLMLKPSLLILDEPTRAVDVGAKMEIYSLIQRLASEGVAILLISSEMPELLALSDRIHVMRAGRLSHALSREQASESTILQMALGQNPAID